MLHQFKMEEIEAEKKWDYMIETGKKASDREEAHIQVGGKVAASQIQASAKLASQSAS